jgi:hypothetical protein
MHPDIFIDKNGNEINSYKAINLSINHMFHLINVICKNNEYSLGYMVRHSKFKGISYSSDDEYVDQFIKMYIPPKKNKENKNNIENNEFQHIENEKKNANTNQDNFDDVPEENIHEFSFDVAYSIDNENEILYIHDPGIGNRINLNSVQNMLQKVVAENNGRLDYIVKYRNSNIICNINEVWVCNSKKSIKFY